MCVRAGAGMGARLWWLRRVLLLVLPLPEDGAVLRWISEKCKTRRQQIKRLENAQGVPSGVCFVESDTMENGGRAADGKFAETKQSFCLG